jgi:uncharacterized protein YjbJ (UPF0337 family)
MTVMKLSVRYQAKGLYRVIKGTVKEKTGNLISNSSLGVKGKFERFTGIVQWKVGKVQGLIGL